MSFTNCKVVGKDVSPLAYHAQEAQRGSKDYIMSPSSLREFGHCPARWKAGYEPPDSDAKDWGSLFDTLALTRDQFGDRYAVEPGTYKNEKGEVKPWNNNSNVCKAWREDQGEKEIVKAKQVEEAEFAIKCLLSDEIVRAWFDCCDRQVLVSGEWKTEAGLIVPVRCLLDFVPRVGSEFEKCLGDLKTCRTAAVLPFQRDAFRMGYHVQAAFDLGLYSAATGEDRNTWCWVLSESYPPYQSGKRMLSQDFLTLGQATAGRLMENYAKCLLNDRWPGYDDHDEAVQNWTIVDAEPFMANAEAFAPKFDFEEQVEPETSEVPFDNLP